ncbi:hypothetical protein BCT23_14260 [Enterovibrio norvegicus]|uniref:Uncharacterized protein n=1 Tax=Enterovibrio norvegicus TaxID=188144 RepID=A0A2N7LBK6_9GAMM|nr:hypothetical protein BCT23_14260 [Enterovibrio norvegicus]
MMGSHDGVFRRIFGVINVFVILGLISLNILTLTSAVVHDAMFKLVNALPISQFTAQSPSSRLTNANRELAATKKANKALKMQTRTVTKRIAKRTATAAARNVGASLMEAVPYIGAAAVVGSLSYDIYDACETLSDIETLQTDLGIESEDVTAETEKVCGYDVPTADELSTKAKASIDDAQRKSAEFGSSFYDALKEKSDQYSADMMETWRGYTGSE